MYQIKVKWSPDCEYDVYNFNSKKEAEAFNFAVEEAASIPSNNLITHSGIIPTTHFMLTLISTILVGFWSMVWWYLGMKFFPDAEMSYSFWQIGVCSSLGYLIATMVAKLFD